jgi:hypothetical protein
MKSFFVALLGLGLVSAVFARGDDLAPPGPVKAPRDSNLMTVVDNYLIIQQRLASDSVDGVPAAAAAMKHVIDADQGKTFDPDFAREVDQLAAATDLHATRIAFQPLSGSLIAILAKHHVQTGTLYSAFCPMVKASWLQTDAKTIHNPYLGSAMPDCGSFQKQF